MERLGAPWSHSERPAHLQGMKTQLQSIGGLEPLLSIEDLAQYLGCRSRPSTTGAWTARVPAAFAFTRSDVLAWIEAQRESRPGQGTGRAVI
jgi:hypothetical protein